MNSRKYSDLGSKRSDLVDTSAVNTLTVVQPLSYDGLLCFIHYLTDNIRQVLILLRVLFNYLVLDREKSCISYVFIVCIKCLFKLISELIHDLIHHIVVKLHRLKLKLRLADLLLDIGNKCDHILYLGMTELDSFKHKVIRDLVSAGFDHNYLFS